LLAIAERRDWHEKGVAIIVAASKMIVATRLTMPRKPDENETAFDPLQEILRRDAARDGIPQPPQSKPEKHPYRVKTGHKAGKIGGNRQAKKLSAKRRWQIAHSAAKRRWKKS